MRLPPLVNGWILRRYQRFLADVELADGRRVVAHVPNTGRMTGCWAPGAPVQLSHSDDPRRKLAWTLERVDMGGGWIGVNTHRVNGVVEEGVRQGRVPGLKGYRHTRREVMADVVSAASRLDLLLEEGPAPPAWVEIKNTTLLVENALCFPDAVTTRGRKHLETLERLRHAGFRAVILFALNRPEGELFRPADEVDPEYGRALRRVVAEGVEAIAVRLRHGVDSIEMDGSVPVAL